MSTSKTDPATSVRRWFSSTLAIVGLGLCLLIGVGLFSLTQLEEVKFIRKLANTGKLSSKLSQEVQRLKDEGEPTSIHDLWPEPLLDSENASIHYMEAVLLLFDPANPRYQKHERNYAAEISERIGKPDLGFAHEGREQLVLDALERAASCKQSKPLLRSTKSILHTHILLLPIRFENRRFLKAIEQERYQDAAEIALRQLHFIPILRNEPGEGAGKVAYSSTRWAMDFLNQVIRTSELTDDFLDRLDAKLALFDNASPYLIHKAKEARADYIEDLQGNDGVQLKWALADPEKMLRIQAHQISLARQPYFQVKDQFYLETPPVTDIASWNYESLFLNRHVTWNYVASKTRCLRVLIAIEKYKALHNAEPTRIEDLGLPTECLKDSLVDGPITIARKADGWWIVWQWGEAGGAPESLARSMSLAKYDTFKSGCVPIPLDED